MKTNTKTSLSKFLKNKFEGMKKNIISNLEKT